MTAIFIQEHPSIKNFIIIGNGASINDKVMAQLGAYGDVSRIDCSNAYDLGVNIANDFFLEPNAFVITSGNDYAPSVAAGPLAAIRNYQILLTPDNDLNPTVEWYLQNNQYSLENFYIMGNSISSIVTDKLNSMVQ